MDAKHRVENVFLSGSVSRQVMGRGRKRATLNLNIESSETNPIRNDHSPESSQQAQQAFADKIKKTFRAFCP
jgi:hypothetical protein